MGLKLMPETQVCFMTCEMLFPYFAHTYLIDFKPYCNANTYISLNKEYSLELEFLYVSGLTLHQQSYSLVVIAAGTKKHFILQCVFASQKNVSF